MRSGVRRASVDSRGQQRPAGRAATPTHLHTAILVQEDVTLLLPQVLTHIVGDYVGF